MLVIAGPPDSNPDNAPDGPAPTRPDPPPREVKRFRGFDLAGLRTVIVYPLRRPPSTVTGQASRPFRMPKMNPQPFITTRINCAVLQHFPTVF